jgi:hypothetical protein
MLKGVDTLADAVQVRSHIISLASDSHHVRLLTYNSFNRIGYTWTQRT